MLGLLFGMGLYEGLSSVFLFNTSKQNAWITTIIATIISLIMFYLLIKIINYEPNKNIIEKINHLFGKVIGQIINFVVFLYIIFLLLLASWSILNFVEIKYLTETPPWFIGGFLIITVTYVVSKGIETITRTTQILIYFSFIVFLIIGIFLFEFFELENIKPIMENGVFPLIIDAVKLSCYTVIPFILLTIIPKNNIIDQKNLTKYFFIGFILSSLLVVWISFSVMTTIGAELAELYRFPTYYTLMKIGVPGIFENLENILACLWISATIILIIMSIYYIHEYLKITFKIKTKKIKNITLFTIAFSLFLLISNPIPDATEISLVVKFFYPFAAIVIFLIMILIYIFSKIKKKNKSSH